MGLRRFAFTFSTTWMISLLAFSNAHLIGGGANPDDATFLEQGKNLSEYPILKELQSLTFDLQMLELIVKNRKDAQIEEKISNALLAIDEQGAEVRREFIQIRAKQFEILKSIIRYAQVRSQGLDIPQQQWTKIEDGILDGTITAGHITVSTPATQTFYVLDLETIHMGRSFLLKVSQPTIRPRFWKWIQKDAWADAKFAEINSLYAQGKSRAESFYKLSHEKLYFAFEDHRYSILQKMHLAHKAITQLSRKNSAMGTASQYVGLYNQLLDHLFSYGVSISLSGEERDFMVQGFLFADTPENSQALLKKLKIQINENNFNSPSS